MKRYMLIGTATLVFGLAAVFLFGRSEADNPEWRGFYGSITYNNCECTDGAYADRVYIKKLPNGPTKSAGVYYCSQGTGTYDTERTDDLVFEPGDYQLWVEFHPVYSECETSYIEQVEHGYSKQQVDLTALGPTDGGSK